MTSRERRTFLILYLGVIPFAVFAIDAWLYVWTDAWTHAAKKEETAAFWPLVLTLGAVLFPIAAGAFAKGFFELWRARASADWAVTEGRVTSSAIEVQKDIQNTFTGWQTVEEYLPKLEYSYAVAGKLYTSHVIAFAIKPFKTREAAENILSSYPKGAVVRVHYDPNDPGAAVLQSTDGFAFRAMGAAVVVALLPFAIAMWIVFLWWHYR